MIRSGKISRSIPKKYRRNRSAWNPRADYISRIGRLLCMNRHQIVNRRIRRHDDGVGSYCATARRGDAGVTAAFDLIGMRFSKNPAAIAFDGLRQPCQIFQRMKLSLSWKMQTGTGVEAFQRGAIKTSHFRESGAM